MKERKNNIYVYIALDVKKRQTPHLPPPPPRLLSLQPPLDKHGETFPDIHELSSRSASPRRRHPDSSSHSWFPVTRRHADKVTLPWRHAQVFCFFFFYPPHSFLPVQSAFKFQFRQTVSASFGKTKQNKKVFGQFHNTLKKYLLKVCGSNKVQLHQTRKEINLFHLLTRKKNKTNFLYLLSKFGTLLKPPRLDLRERDAGLRVTVLGCAPETYQWLLMQ